MLYLTYLQTMLFTSVDGALEDMISSTGSGAVRFISEDTDHA